MSTASAPTRHDQDKCLGRAYQEFLRSFAVYVHSPSPDTLALARTQADLAVKESPPDQWSCGDPEMLVSDAHLLRLQQKDPAAWAALLNSPIEPPFVYEQLRNRARALL